LRTSIATFVSLMAGMIPVLSITRYAMLTQRKPYGAGRTPQDRRREAEWGGRLQVRVAPDGLVACVSEQTSRGITLAHGFVFSAVDFTIYFADAGVACPDRPTPEDFNGPGWTAGERKP